MCYATYKIGENVLYINTIYILRRKSGGLCRNFSVRRGISGAWGLGDSPERCIFVLKTKMTDRMRRQFVRWVLCLFLLGSAVAYAQSGMTDSQVIEYVQQALQQGKDQQTIAMELLAKGATQEQLLRLKSQYSVAAASGSVTPAGESGAQLDSSTRTRKTGGDGPRGRGEGHGGRG